MNNKILITYASRSGSTAEIAEAIGKTLSQRGAQVEVLPMTQVTDLAPYQAIVAGSTIHGQKWLPEAMTFVSDHRPSWRANPLPLSWCASRFR